jgi:hypothetical protein
MNYLTTVVGFRISDKRMDDTEIELDIRHVRVMMESKQ